MYGEDHDDSDVPEFLDRDGVLRTPIAWREYADRDERIRMLCRSLFAEARHRGRGGR
jgi:hypothetical protein